MDALPALGVEPVAVATTSSGRIVAARGSVIDFTGTAIVNAANEGCMGGGGVDGAVTAAGGEALHQARIALPQIRPRVRCNTGDAVTTIGGDLQAQYCIHAVGPNYRLLEDEDESDLLLYKAYHASMREARAKAMPAVAFSLLSAGIFRGRRPLRMVLAIGVLAISAGMHGSACDVFLVGFTQAEVETLTDLIDALLVRDDAETARAEILSHLSPELQETHQRAIDGTLDVPPPVGVALASMAITAVFAHPAS